MGTFSTLWSRGSSNRTWLAAMAAALVSPRWLGRPVLDAGAVGTPIASSPFAVVERWDARYTEAAAAHDLFPPNALGVTPGDAPVLTWVGVRNGLRDRRAPTGWIQGSKDLAKAIADAQISANDRERFDRAARTWFAMRLVRPFASTAAPPVPPTPRPSTPTPPEPTSPEPTSPEPTPAAPGMGGLKTLAFFAFLAALAKRRRREGWF
jgi:hypothetical protein